MKKIFTLICMAFVAMSVSAQETTQTFSVADDGTFNTTDRAQGIQVKDGDKACANVVILSSPYPDDEYKFVSYDATNHVNIYDETQPINPWTLQEAANQSLSVINEKFTKRLDGKGNPFKTNNFEWVEGESSSDGTKMLLVDANTTNTIFVAGGDALPVRGMYIKCTPIVSGKLQIGVRIPNGNHPLYVIPVDASTTVYNPLPVAQFTKVRGYFNNNGWNTGADKTPFELTMPESYIIQDQEVTWTEYPGTENEQTKTQKPKQVFLGIVEFTVEKGKTYWIFSPKSQVGFYGFTYTYDKADFDSADPLPEPDVPSAIKAIRAIENGITPNAPIYNLSGQKVDKSYKGLVIQNGRKFVNK